MFLSYFANKTHKGNSITSNSASEVTTIWRYINSIMIIIIIIGGGKIISKFNNLLKQKKSSLFRTLNVS